MQKDTSSNFPVLRGDGSIWFVVKDVCQVLKISNARHAITNLDGDEKNTIVFNDGIRRGNPKMNIIFMILLVIVSCGGGGGGGGGSNNTDQNALSESDLSGNYRGGLIIFDPVGSGDLVDMTFDGNGNLDGESVFFIQMNTNLLNIR